MARIQLHIRGSWVNYNIFVDIFASSGTIKQLNSVATYTPCDLTCHYNTRHRSKRSLVARKTPSSDFFSNKKLFFFTLWSILRRRPRSRLVFNRGHGSGLDRFRGHLGRRPPPAQVGGHRGQAGSGPGRGRVVLLLQIFVAH